MGGRPPELGAFAHFLQTAIYSESRRHTSPLLAGLFKLISGWPDSGWLVTSWGLYGSLLALTRDFRNRAAHLDTLTQTDYSNCREFVLGGDGILWRLVAATR